jgi:hypothetical protein
MTLETVGRENRLDVASEIHGLIGAGNATARRTSGQQNPSQRALMV